MVPRREHETVEATHEPAAPKGVGQLWESGAEDARTPNAGASSDGSLEVAKRLECVRFIGAFASAWSSQRFMVSMRAKFGVEAFHEPERRSPTRREPRDLSERARFGDRRSKVRHKCPTLAKTCAVPANHARRLPMIHDLGM